MSLIQPQAASPRDVLKLLRQYPLRWILPAVIVTVVAVGYARFRPAVWEASQALMVRDEAIGGDHLGRFHVAEDMKTVQETILELAHGHSVVSTALAIVGPPADRKSQAPWPSEQDVAALAGSMKLSPPKGAEFGKTEVFYLQVQNTDRQRAVDLASALCDQLKKRFEDLRDAKARSLVEELGKTVTIANNDLESATVRLAQMDAKAGADLGELRTLLDTPTGDSPLRHSITEMETELRTACVAVDSNDALLKLLEAAKSDPHALAAAPSRLLDSQPSLRRLKDGLVDAEIHTSQMLGTMSESHPLVVAAKAAEDSINQQVHEELDAAATSVAVELRLARQRAAVLQAQIAAVRGRLNHLADIRAEYANTVAEVHLRTDTLKTAETQLGEARASQAAAHTASLLSRIDTPDTGAYPIGPSRSVIAAGGAAGGLILGLGLLFLTVPPLVLRNTDRRLVDRERADDVGSGPEHFADVSQSQVASSTELASTAASFAPAEHTPAPAPVLATVSKRPPPAGPLSFGQALAKLQTDVQEPVR